MTPSVSIIIPAHGHPGLVRACVESIHRSAANPAEIVIVDDCSPEPIGPESAVGARLIRAETNLGFAGACNLGAANTTSDLILFLNSDTEVHGNWLQQLVSCCEPDVAIVGARLLYRDGTTQHAGIIFSQEDGAPRHAYRGFPGDHAAVCRTRDMQAVTGACLLIRREDFLPGGFDEGYENGFEDVDLCLRVHEMGRRVVYCGATEITHLESVSLRTDSGDGHLRHEKNLTRFSDRWNNTAKRDELVTYESDGLIRVGAGDVYPLAVAVSAEVGIIDTDATVADLARLLNTRARQVFDLQKDVGRYRTLLLDNGLLPDE